VVLLHVIVYWKQHAERPLPQPQDTTAAQWWWLFIQH